MIYTDLMFEDFEREWSLNENFAILYLHFCLLNLFLGLTDSE